MKQKLPRTNNYAKTLLHSLERAAAGIGFHVMAHKTEYIGFNQTGNISTLNGSFLKLVEKFTYLGSSVTSTETDINSWLDKALTVIDSVTWCPPWVRRNKITTNSSVFELTVASRQRMTVKRVNVSQAICTWSPKEALTNHLTVERRRWKPNEWLGP